MQTADAPAAQPERPEASAVEVLAPILRRRLQLQLRQHGPLSCRQLKLPENAEVQTLKAAEHYIEVVSDCGNDLLRYRFNDAIRQMQPLDIGGQVHRSWWVSWDSVARVVQRSGGSGC